MVYNVSIGRKNVSIIICLHATSIQSSGYIDRRNEHDIRTKTKIMGQDNRC